MEPQAISDTPPGLVNRLPFKRERGRPPGSNSKPIPLPEQDYLKACFAYDPESGVLRWRERPCWHFNRTCVWRSWNMKYAGHVISSIDSKGYIKVCIDRRSYRAHRIVWKIMTGNDPVDQLDHRDRNRANNSWVNLRQASNSENGCNRSVSANSIVGIKGVVYRYGRFYARIMRHKKEVYLGGYATIAEAARAYRTAARMLHREFARFE